MSNSAKIIFKKNTILTHGNFLGKGSGVNGTGSVFYSNSNNDNLNQIVLVRKVIDSNSIEKKHLVGISQYNISHNISKYNNKIYFHKKRNDEKIDLNVKNNNLNYINNVPYLLDNSINFINSDGNTENFVNNFNIVLNFRISNFSTSLLKQNLRKSGININFDLSNMLKNLYNNENNIQQLNLTDINNNSNYHLTKYSNLQNLQYLLDFIRASSPTIKVNILSSDNSSKNYNIYFTYIYKET